MTFGREVQPEERALLLTEPRAAAVEAIVDAVADRRSVVLVGERGSGKSMLAKEALRRLADDGWLAFEAPASSVHAGQHYVGMLEGRVQEIARRMDGQPIVWVLPEFNEALWAGAHQDNPHGLLDALLPYLEWRQVVVIAEVEPRGLELVVQHRPKTTALFEPIRVTGLDERETLEAVRGWADEVGVVVSDETLAEAYELADHYLPGLAAPGNVLRLLRSAAARTARTRGAELQTADVLATLSETSGLPLHLLDANTRLDLGNVHAFFADRILGQPEAVECLVERIALIKARLTDPNRPLGVFLFVGPTGTGKTEIAKALAEFLFGSSRRLVRLDMTEFQTWESVDRLLSDTVLSGYGSSLLSSVRKEPFSVVLLDEFEKAHPNAWDLFLQVFDDGRLTDRQGRTADFRHCVVILTSNVGSALAAGPALGFAGEREPLAAGSVHRAVERSFRPELLNRIDRVVAFRPLAREQMRDLVHIELRHALDRRGFRIRPWAIEWDDAAIEFLLDKGFSSELGARPLKRAIDTHLLSPLATTIVERDFPAGDQFLFISAREGRIAVTFVDPDAPDAAETAAATAAESGLDLKDAGALADRADRIVEFVAADAWQLEKARLFDATHQPWFWDRDDRFEVLGRLEYLDRLEEATRTAKSLSARVRARGAGAGPLVVVLAERVHLLEHALAGLERGDPADAVVSIRPASSVHGNGERHGFRGRARGDVHGVGEEEGHAPLAGRPRRHRPPPRLRAGRLHHPRGRVGAARPRGARAGALVERVGVVVEVAAVPFGASEPSEPTPDADAQHLVRRYRRDPSPLVRDAVRGWRTGKLDRVLAGDFDLMGP